MSETQPNISTQVQATARMGRSSSAPARMRSRVWSPSPAPRPVPRAPAPNEQPIQTDLIMPGPPHANPKSARDSRDIQHFFEITTWQNSEKVMVCKLCR